VSQPGGLSKGMAWTTLSTAWGALSDLVAVIILSHLLSPTQVGLVQAAAVLIGFAFLISQGGFAGAIIQFPEATKAHFSTTFLVALTSGTVQTLVVFFAAEPLAYLFGLPEAAPLFRAVSLIYGLTTVGRVGLSFLARDLRFQTLAKIELAGSITNFTVSIGTAFVGWGVWAPVFGNIAQAVALLLLGLGAAPPPFPLRFSREALRELAPSARGFSSSLMLNYTANNVDNVIVGRMLGASALGVYARAYNLTARPAIVVAMSVYKTLFPAMARIQDQPERLRELYERAVLLVSLLTMPAGVALSLLAPEAVLVLLGRPWGAAVVPFQVLSLCLFFRAVSEVGTGLARAVGQPRDQVLPKLGYAIAVIVGTILGATRGLPEVAYLVLLANVLHFVFSGAICIRKVRMSWSGLLALQKGPVLVSMLVLVVAAGTTEAMRRGGLPPAATLVAAVTTSGMAWLAALRFFPIALIGRDAARIVRRKVKVASNI